MKNKWIIPAAGVAVIAGLTLLFTKGFLHIQKPVADISIGRVLLSEMQEQDIGAVQGQIQELQNARDEVLRAQREAEEAALIAQHEAEMAAQAAADAEAQRLYYQQWCDEANALADADQFKAIFANSIVVGDSIVEGIVQTDILLPSSVVSKIGASLDDLMDLLPEMQARAPQKIFIYCGFNDIGMCRGDVEKYYSQYTEFVQSLQAVCPGVPIYINHLVRPLHLETLQAGIYMETDTYNGIIDQVAAENGLGIIETADLVVPEFYYKDGYHMIYPFYPLWMRRMAEASGLM